MTATIVHREDGGVEIRGWPGWAAQVIDEMVLLAGPEIPDERARARLFPLPAADPDAAEEWRRNQHPDLFALLASAQEVVAKDLSSARRTRSRGIVRLVIPQEHLAAWIAAVNAARLHLSAAHDVDAAAMTAPFEELSDDLRPAVVRIDMLGELQHHLIRAVEPLLPADPGPPEPDPGAAPPGAGGAAKPRKPRKRTPPPRKPRAAKPGTRAPRSKGPGGRSAPSDDGSPPARP